MYHNASAISPLFVLLPREKIFAKKFLLPGHPEGGRFALSRLKHNFRTTGLAETASLSVTWEYASKDYGDDTHQHHYLAPYTRPLSRRLPIAALLPFLRIPNPTLIAETAHGRSQVSLKESDHDHRKPRSRPSLHFCVGPDPAGQRRGWPWLICILPWLHSPDLAVESLEQTHERFLAFFHRIKQNLMPPGYVSGLSGRDRGIVSQLATTCFERRTRQAGLNRVPEKDKKDLFDLARSGGRLLGPTTLDEVDLLAARLHEESPWMVDVTRFLMRHMRDYVRSGGGGLHRPPIILAGPPGIGKSWFARSIAEAVALPNRVIDVGAGSAAFRAVGTEKGWSSVQPGLPIETMLQSHVANPLMIVDEIDKAGVITSSKGTSSSLVTALLGLLDPGTAPRFECPAMRVQFDMSRVIWILTANDVGLIPPPLRDRCRVFHMSHLSVAAALAFFDRMARDICGADGLKATTRAFVATQAGCRKISLRQISRLIDTLRSGNDDGLIH